MLECFVIPAAAPPASPTPAGRSGVEEFKERTAGKLRDLRCPVHGQPPRLRFQGASLRDITLQMSACCDQLIGLANKRVIER